MFNEQNTYGYSQEEISIINNELNERLMVTDDIDKKDLIEKAFSDEVAKR